jgi:hypothetical protein
MHTYVGNYRDKYKTFGSSVWHILRIVKKECVHIYMQC